MATHATVWYGIMSTAAGAIAVGQAVVKNSSDEWVPSTAANRALYGRSRGVAKTPADTTNRTFEIQVAGPLSASVSGIASGSSGDWVIVDANGNLLRDATPDAGEDVIGRCPHTSAEVQIAPGVWDETNTLGGGGAATPTGTGFPHVTAGVQDAAAKLVENADVHASAAIASSKVVQATGTGFPRVTAGVLDAASIGETGSGSVVRANTPTLVTPNIGAATGTSLNLSGALTLGTDLSVSNGGTGASSFTSGRFLFGNGAGAIAESGAGFVYNAGVITADIVLEWGAAGGVFPGHGYNKVVKDAGDWLVTRNNLNNADLTAVAFAADALWLGSDAAGTYRFPTVTVNGTSLELYGSSGGGGTGRIKLDASGFHIQDAGGDHFLTLAVPNLAANRTLSVPLLAGNDTAVTEAHTQTLSNKTFVAPVLGAASGTSVALSSFAAIGGGTLATSGYIRVANAAATIISARDAADSENLQLVNLSAGNVLNIGTDTTFAAARQVSGINIYAIPGAAIAIGLGGGTAVYVTSGGVGVYQSANLGVYGNAGTFPDPGGGVGVFAMRNATTNPSTNPVNGIAIYSDAGAGKCRGSGGTVTTFGPSEPHCPRCGTDVGISQSENDLFGEELIHCHACELKTGNGVVRHFADFFDRKKVA